MWREFHQVAIFIFSPKPATGIYVDLGEDSGGGVVGVDGGVLSGRRIEAVPGCGVSLIGKAIRILDAKERRLPRQQLYLR